MDVMRLGAIFFSMVLVNNYVLVKFLGICPFLGVSKKLDSSIGMSAAVIFVMIMATAVTWPIDTYILQANDLTYLRTITFILVIASLVQLVEIVLKKYIPGLYNSLGVFLPLITTNCAILGVALLNVESGYNFVESMVGSLGAGIGFMLAMVIFTGVRSRVDQAKPPKSFEGLPLTLVAAALVALSFTGFGGIVESIFGAI